MKQINVSADRNNLLNNTRIEYKRREYKENKNSKYITQRVMTFNLFRKGKIKS